MKISDKRLFNSLLGSALERLGGLHHNCRDNCNGLRATRLVTCNPRGLTAPEDMCQIQLPALARFFSEPILLAFFWISHTAPLYSGVSDSLYAACHTRAYPVIRKYRHFPACSREIPSSSNERERLIAPVVSVLPVTQQQAGLLLGLPRRTEASAACNARPVAQPSLCPCHNLPRPRPRTCQPAQNPPRRGTDKY